MTNCDKCQHGKEHHRDNICYAEICTCIKFEEPLPKLEVKIPVIETGQIYSRTSIPLPMFITTHDNWGGTGWEYKKKYGKTQKEMVEFLSQKCQLTEDEIRRFLRCKAPSVRGRLSELRTSKRLLIMRG